MSKTAELALDAAALLTSYDPALAAVFKGAKLSLGVIRQTFPNADDGLTEFIDREVQETVFTVVPALLRKYRDLETKLNDKPSVTQVALIYKAFVHGFCKADGKKRTLLLNALVNAFDSDLYQKSMTARLLAMIDDLDYPDLQFLMGTDSKPTKQATPWGDPKGMDCYHANRLAAVGLMSRERGVPDRADLDSAYVSGVGAMMVKLIRDPATGDHEEHSQG